MIGLSNVDNTADASKSVSFATSATNATNATTAATVSTTVASGAVGTTQTYGTVNTTIATTAFVQAALSFVYPVGCIYTTTVATNPGSVFGFGTWSAFGAGRVMIGAGGGFTAGDTGGSADAIVVSHTHNGSTSGASVDHSHGYSGTTGIENQNHVHLMANPDAGTYQNLGANYGGDWQTGGYGGTPNGTYTTGINNVNHTHTFSGTSGGQSVSHTHTYTTDSAGSSGTNANYQPYVVVYMWKRDS
jgi:hypothetical protein